MEEGLGKRKGRKRVTVIALALVLGLCLMGGGLLYLTFELRSAWQSYNDFSANRNQALSTLHRSIGYDGFIHNFKNYVLRKDMDLLIKVERDLDHAFHELRVYYSFNRSLEESDALDAIRKTLTEYKSNLEIARQAIALGLSPAEIDKKVKVNDLPAIEALAVLQSNNQRYAEQFSTLLENQIWRLVITLLMGLLVVPFVVLGIYHYNDLIGQMFELAAEKQKVNKALADTAAEAEQVKVQHRQMEHQAYHCDLTKIANRKAFTEKGQLMLAKADEAGHRVSVLFVDVDDFKSINDQLGHEVGDAVLIEVASRLGEAIREDDMVARLGGDEFALIVAGNESSLSRNRLANRLRMVMNESYESLHEGLQVSCSVGGAVYPDEGSNLESLIRVADERMYSVKRSGKNGVYLPDQV